MATGNAGKLFIYKVCLIKVYRIHKYSVKVGLIEVHDKFPNRNLCHFMYHFDVASFALSFPKRCGREWGPIVENLSLKDGLNCLNLTKLKLNSLSKSCDR